MNKRDQLNCLNCGAAFDTSLEACPYCGTSYYDMSTVTLGENKPFMLKVKTNIGGKIVYITQLVVADAGNFTLTSDTCTAHGGAGASKLCTFVNNQTLNIDLQFTAIPRKNGSLCEIKTED